MNEYLLDPNVCPSSLGEDDKPVDPNETAHKWDRESNPISCSECGSIKEPLTLQYALDTLDEYAQNNRSVIANDNGEADEVTEAYNTLLAHINR